VKVKKGTLVALSEDVNANLKYQFPLWDSDFYFLRDPFSMKISNSWIKFGDICIVVDQDKSKIMVLTPRGGVGWISKEKMEIIK